eukprot:contig_22306_g5511
MAVGRTTRWVLAALTVAAAAVAVATPSLAGRGDSCVVKTKRCCFDPVLCGVVTKKYVKLVKHICLKKLTKKIRVRCHYGGGGHSYRMAEVTDADAADAAVAASDSAAPVDSTTAKDVSPAVPDVVSRSSYTYRPPHHERKWCFKKVTVVHKAHCVKKVVRVKFFPKICYKKKCTVEVHGHGRAKASYVDYNRGVDDDKVGGGGAHGYFRRTLGY